MEYHYNLKHKFDFVVEMCNKNIALSFPNKVYTYNELDTKSEELASFLSQKGICKGSVVAIISDKTFENFALMIACLKLGIAYTNLDKENPEERTRSIFQTCRPRAVFSYECEISVSGLCDDMEISYYCFDKIEPSRGGYRKYDFDGDTIAYIMFTSGSTGIPKGVAVTHQNLLHFINWSVARYDVNESDNFVNVNPLYFDNSVFDFYTSLFTGACLTPVEKNLLQRPIELVKYVDSKQCTIWFSVPTLLMFLNSMKVLNSTVLRSIRVFTFGGEGYPKPELLKIYNMYKDTAKFINVYGPTEGTCICSSYTLSDSDFDDLSELPSLGRINNNFSYIILNNGIKGKEGELCLLGPNVSRGYYQDEDRTKEKFSFYSDEEHYRKPMYRTGDIVQEKNGLLYFLGRIDNQIKHMGYRIELEEIEGRLNSIEGIRQCVVLYKRVNISFGKIIAVIIPDDESISIESIRQKLRSKLPSYMIPNVYKFLESFPTNANGKVDRNQLKELIEVI